MGSKQNWEAHLKKTIDTKPIVKSNIKLNVKPNKVSKVMHEFKKGKLNIGKSKKKVKSRRQAIAIALSEAGMSKGGK